MATLQRGQDRGGTGCTFLYHPSVARGHRQALGAKFLQGKGEPEGLQEAYPKLSCHNQQDAEEDPKGTQELMNGI